MLSKGGPSRFSNTHSCEKGLLKMEMQNGDNDADRLLEGLSLPWTVTAAGDMTLCVVDGCGLRVLKIDMLTYRTMAAGDSGERLARAYNDLAIVSQCPALVANAHRGLPSAVEFPYVDAGHSPFPWRMEISPRKAKLIDGAGKMIADLEIPASNSRNYEKTVLSIRAAALGLDHVSNLVSDTHPGTS